MDNLRKQVDMSNPTCAFPGCGKRCITPVIVYCTGHYAQQQKGHELTPILRTLEERFWAKVRRTESCWEWVGAKRQRGYGSVQFHGKVRTAHRVAWELTRGPLDDSQYLDHICHNTSCVRPDHLRPGSQSQNMENRNGANSSSKTGVRGVHRHGNRYQASVTSRGVRHHVGSFATIEEAEAAVVEARNRIMTFNDRDRSQQIEA